MLGPVEWAALSFVCGLIVSSAIAAWMARGFLAGHDLKTELKLAAIEKKLDLALAVFEKDIRHLKNNLAQHGNNYAEMHDDLIRAQAEVARLGKIVNGKH